MSLSLELTVVAGSALGAAMSATALVLELRQRKGKIFDLANSREEDANTKSILQNADKDIKDLVYQIDQLARTAEGDLEREKVRETKSLLNQVLENLHRIPSRSLK